MASPKTREIIDRQEFSVFKSGRQLLPPKTYSAEPDHFFLISLVLQGLLLFPSLFNNFKYCPFPGILLTLNISRSAPWQPPHCRETGASVKLKCQAQGAGKPRWYFQ
jgi:hypothetical protein